MHELHRPSLDRCRVVRPIIELTVEPADSAASLTRTTQTATHDQAAMTAKATTATTNANETLSKRTDDGSAAASRRCRSSARTCIRVGAAKKRRQPRYVRPAGAHWPAPPTKRTTPFEFWNSAQETSASLGDGFTANDPGRFAHAARPSSTQTARVRGRSRGRGSKAFGPPIGRQPVSEVWCRACGRQTLRGWFVSAGNPWTDARRC